MAAPSRPTQAQRREATIAKLVDATVECLGELGHARTTTAEISRRTGISAGGLFRHFPTRLDLVLAAADAVRARQFAAFGAGLQALEEVTVQECLVLLRRACRAPMNAAWYELLVAARHDEGLRAGLVPLLERYHREICELGRTLPVAQLIPEDELDTLLLTVVHLLDGEAVTAVVLDHPEQEDRRITQLVRLIAGAVTTP